MRACKLPATTYKLVWPPPKNGPRMLVRIVWSSPVRYKIDPTIIAMPMSLYQSHEPPAPAPKPPCKCSSAHGLRPKNSRNQEVFHTITNPSEQRTIVMPRRGQTRKMKMSRRLNPTPSGIRYLSGTTRVYGVERSGARKTPRGESRCVSDA